MCETTCRHTRPAGKLAQRARSAFQKVGDTRTGQKGAGEKARHIQQGEPRRQVATRGAPPRKGDDDETARIRKQGIHGHIEKEKSHVYPARTSGGRYRHPEAAG